MVVPSLASCDRDTGQQPSEKGLWDLSSYNLTMPFFLKKYTIVS